MFLKIRESDSGQQDCEMHKLLYTHDKLSSCNILYLQQSSLFLKTLVSSSAFPRQN